MLGTKPIGTSYAGENLIEEGGNSSSVSAVSWPAVFAGGVSAAAIAAILVIFGTGLGLASVSPWAGSGVSATTFTVLAAIWLIIVQWVSAAIGGYMAGRLRTKWVGVHTDEVFFRDTAHGFLAWALATLITVGLIAAAATSGLSGGAHMAMTAVSGTSTSNNYYVEQLFRQNANTTASSLGYAGPAPASFGSDQQVRADASTILAQGAVNGAVSAPDNAYLTQLVSERTGLAPADAQARVTDVLNEQHADAVKAKQIADATRKATSGAAIYTFISMLIGAFIASVAGALGGRLRDNY